ncbi:helix-turn-helix domain-containing protein [Nocardioides sp.]|uniref:helix-turn-helix domain-containing protein n=1 Tax=Nocardioides sp. TaxID=35761 RepID=UPI003211F37C
MRVCPRCNPISAASGLERCRLAAGLTLADVATELARDPRSIRRYELGQTMPPKPIMLRLARLYQCPVEALVD